MREPAATIEAGGEQLKETTAPGLRDPVPVLNSAAPPRANPQQRGGGGMKFTHASGSRPLDGYTIKRGVGIGGFGQVYFATNDAGKEVALKQVQRNMDVELRGVRQCLNLKHQNLIGLYDIRYDDEGGAWVVMEYVAGEILTDIIERNPNGLPKEEADAWFRGIASGVAHLHDHGIVHRDLKPGNIFVEHDIVKIGDYGLSKFISCSRRSGQTESVGTFHYMAPEIGKGVYGKEIDVYALGIILFELLTGRVPFDGETSQEIMMKHLTADPDLSGVPQPYRAVIERSLYKDPDKRFADVAALLRRLDGEDAVIEETYSDLVEVIDAEPVPAAAHVAKPPVVSQAGGSTSQPDDSPLYIGDDQASEGEIVFGPVRERPSSVGKTAAQTHATSHGGARPTTRLNAAGQTTDEPVARAVKKGIQGTYSWWRDAKMSAPLKVLVVFAVLFVLLINVEWLLPAAIFAGAVYLVYFGIRSLVMMLNEPRSRRSGSSQPGVATTQVASNGASNTYRFRQASLHKRVRQVVLRKPASEKVSELTGSFLMSALVAAVLGIVMMILGRQTIDSSVGTWSFYAWMVLTSTAGAWIVLGLGKLWEGSEGDAVLRRFAMLIGGLVVGCVAFFGSQLLMVDLADAPSISVPISIPWPNSLTENMYAADGAPLLPAYLVYFGGLFLILMWWKRVDPLRRTRLNIWSTASCALWAWILNMFWQFPQPWGFMLAMIIAISVQLAAPWIGADEREELAQQYRQV